MTLLHVASCLVNEVIGFSVFISLLHGNIVPSYKMNIFIKCSLLNWITRNASNFYSFYVLYNLCFATSCECFAIEIQTLFYNMGCWNMYIHFRGRGECCKCTSRVSSISMLYFIGIIRCPPVTKKYQTSPECHSKSIDFLWIIAYVPSHISWSIVYIA